MKQVILIAVVCAFVAAPTLADMTVVVANNPGGANNGGPFTATVTGDPIGGYATGASFRTFCLETGITYNPGQMYYGTVDSGAISGGGGAVGGSDPISAQTAWLYNNYLDGTLVYLSGYTESDRGSAVQEAIWRLEDETSHSTPSNVVTLALNLINQANTAVTSGYTNTNVMALNLWSNANHTGDAQSMLVRVPVPAAALLGMLGLSAAGLRLRRRV